ncbi:hypothetical protein OH809_41150 [Streptomyces sp. NBC_00873]|uniref:hypothetical protein n=1 Tax=Streptomyces sp. NBC_00873 TaxID=2975852 RepID=UPI00386E03F7|nr:hypothetical protein OH809_41150 [Streptomyces sp. NBC_00873]
MYGQISPNAVTMTLVPDNITEEPALLRHLLVLTVRDGPGVNEQTAERHLAAHERHHEAANR